MRLRIEAADADSARDEARRRLAEHGVDVDVDALMAREDDAAGGGGVLRRLFRRTKTYVVQVDPHVLRRLSRAERYRLASAMGAEFSERQRHGASRRMKGSC